MILKKINSSRFSEVVPEWEGETVAILAGGSSLTKDQVEKVKDAHQNKKVRCIAVNDTYILAPWADVSYAADLRWHRWHTEGIEIPALELSAEQVCSLWSSFKGQKCSIENNAGCVPDEKVHILKNANGNIHGFGLSLDPRSLVTGRNSGFQALNLAVLSGAKKIILLGFDGKVGDDGKTHWFGNHPERTSEAAFAYYRQAMSYAEEDLEKASVCVFNCSLKSSINSFPKVPLEELL